MGNHVHLIVIPKSEAGLARALGRMHCEYARWVNVQRGEVGHLWQNCFYSCPLDQQHQWEALRYVELNPVRAVLVRAAWDWPWSSAAAHVNGVDRMGVLDTVEWEMQWGAARWLEVLAQSARRRGLIEHIREATRTGRPAASENFVRELETRMGRRLRPQKRGPKVKLESADTQFSLVVS